ncbi:hypothetical protein VHEMI04433 [[Torrubiella] hemipterigena]|nr:hypothetical protein VHEMI04433 [[Torrubiella] hemipterigena]
MAEGKDQSTEVTSLAVERDRISTRSPQSEGSQPSPAPPNQTVPAPTLSNRCLDAKWYFKGMQILSPRGAEWMSSRTGEAVDLETFRLLTTVNKPPASASPPYFPPQELHQLPEEEATFEAIGIFNHASIQYSLPMLDRVLFQETVKRAYMQPSDAVSMSLQVPAKACVWALHAMTNRLQRIWGHGDRDSEKSAQKALTLLQLVAETPSLETLQATLLLQNYQALGGQWRKSSFLHMQACRMVCDLGGHFFQPRKGAVAEDGMAARQTRCIRALFWFCYVRDKDIALRSGTPPLLTEDYCDLSWPPLPGILSNTNTAEHTYQLSNDPRLSMIKEKACRLLFSPKAFQSVDSEILLNIRQLDVELEQWRLAIPSTIRPRLAIPAGQPLLPSDASMLQRIQCINLQLDYHYTVATLHTTVRRCGNTKEDEILPEDLHKVIHSSVDLSIEASRSTLAFFRTSVDILGEGAFQYISLYVLNAAMVLFVNILIHPYYRGAQSEFDLLTAAVDVIQGISSRALSTYEMTHLQEITRFIKELVRLGKCSISRPGIEDDHHHHHDHRHDHHHNE